MFDLVIKNAKLVDGSGVEIAVRDGKIVEISEEVTGITGKTYDAKGSFVSAGWIDSHVHCFEKMTLYYDNPDKVGVSTGVTTVVDAGSTGEANIHEFYQLAKQAKTNVYALLNISKYGIVTQDELSDLSKVDEQSNVGRIQEMQGFIIGIKVRMSKSVIGENGSLPLEMAKALQKKVNLPLMVHIGSAPLALDKIFELLEPGDIITHCFNGKDNGILDESGQMKDFAVRAFERGIHFDIGHGTDSFNFHTAKVAFDQGVKAQSISSDIYHTNRENGPVYNLATTMEKLLQTGYTLQEVIDAVTQNAAKTLGLTTKGKLEVGMDGDFTVFDCLESEKELVDSNNNKVSIQEQIMPKAAIVSGVIYETKRRKQ
ncbi:MAG: amidohydrolase/deacetylase family metallohydrolase [Streptococcaceae bacterium]|jgi:dihydroorotase|nr:amidohydrolase/deacetylase family metallohydrolase [Streptococcaceae bacterium]